MSAVKAALLHVKGTYRLAVVCMAEPGVIVGARLGSPLVIGIGPDGHFLASDANALAGYATQVVYLNDRQICQLDAESWVIRNQDLDTVDAPLQEHRPVPRHRRRGVERLPALHAQRNLRAARGDRQRHARPPGTTPTPRPTSAA